jgi:hypothetical protein
VRNYRIVKPGPGEVEVLHHLRFGQAQILGNARIAHVLQRMATDAVVEEQLGSTLQRSLVTHIGAGLHQRALAALGMHGHGADQQA